MMLTGECNQCGACCFTKYGAVCENLEILTRQGLPNATGAESMPKDTTACQYE